MSNINLILFVVELVFLHLAIISNAFFIFIIARHNVMHNNFKVLMSAGAICIIIIAVLKIPQDLLTALYKINVYEEHAEFEYLMYTCSGVINCLIIPLTLERVIATLKSSRYETETTPIFGCASIFILVLLMWSFNIYILKQMCRPESMVNNEMVYSSNIQRAMISMAIFHIISAFTCYFTVIFLFYYNRRCYINSFKVGRKYQYSENVRTSVQLMHIIFNGFVCNLIISIIVIISFSSKTPNVILKQIIDLILSFSNNVTPICALCSHPVLRRICLSYPKRISFKVTRRIIPSMTLTTPKSFISNQSLIISGELQRQVYFESLKNSWNRPR